MYELIIIGGGPAGIAAGIYAARKKLKAVLLTKDFIGQTGKAGIIENWPGEKEILGPELISKFEDHLKSYDIDIKEEEVVNVEKGFTVKTDKESYSSRAVLVTSGRKPRALNVPGEEEFIGKGVVYCTTCDAPLFQDKTVVVVGGGNSGFESAIELTDYAKKVYLFESFSEIVADEFLQEKAQKKGVEVFVNRKVTAVRGEKFLEEIDYEESGKKDSLKIDGLFVQIGSVPISSFLGDLVDYNEGGDIKIDARSFETKTEGLFAAGDVTDIKYKQIVIATGEGVKATLSAYDYLKKK